MTDRRQFLLTAAHLLPLALACSRPSPGRAGPGLAPALRPSADEATGLSLLQLPEGFRYSSLGWTGDAMTDGRPTPPMHDGMAVVRARGDRLTLIRNHEITHDGSVCYHCWLPERFIREKPVKLTVSTLGLLQPTKFLKDVWAGLDGTRFEQPS